MNKGPEQIDLLSNDEERRIIQLDDEEEAHGGASGHIFCRHDL
jgi:hypothetical protein